MDYPGNLDLLTVGQAGKEETVNALFSAFSPAVGFGRRASTSAGLTWGYYGGVIAISDEPTVIANGTVTLTDDATCYIRLKDSDGTVDHVTSPPTDWPKPNGGYTALYEVTTAAGACTAWTDYRIARGPQGPTGSTGPAGATGPSGGGGGGGGINGLLTLTSGTPITTSDVTGATDVYFTPFRGNTITLWDGAAWSTIEFTETTLALGTLTSGKNYDVFGYDNSGTLALEKLVWTDDTTRATAVTLQDGRYCKSGDKTRIYLGTFRTTSTTTTEDSAAKRFLYSVGQGRRRGFVSSTSSHAYGTATPRYWNNSSANAFAFVLGLAEAPVDVILSARITPGSAGNQWWVSTDLDAASGTTDAVDAQYMLTSGGSYNNAASAGTSYNVGVGYHYIAVLENAPSASSGTFPWYSLAVTF